MVAVGSLLSSRSQPTPIAAQRVESTAVVVSSLACRDGSGGTLVDLVSSAELPAGTAVRASLDACGYQEGEQLVVQFPPSDPTQVSLVGDPDADAVAGPRLLPYGLALAALLAIGAAVAVWIDARRSRRRSVGHLLAGHQESDGQDSPVVPLETGTRNSRGGRAMGTAAGRHESLGVSDSAGAQIGEVPTDRPAVVGESARADPEVSSSTMVQPVVSRDPTGRHARPDPADDWPDWASPLPHLRESADRLTAGDDSADHTARRLTSVDMAFPCTASLADSLHDELFTHRGGWI